MRTISLSDSTYAAIWARWKEGDDGEEGVIRRLLGLSVSPKESERRSGRSFIDPRSGVEFPEGFEIFRVYKGREHRSTVVDGAWRNASGRVVLSINQLSKNIGAGTENAWVNWYYRDEHGKQHLIDNLRDKSKVTRRS